MSFGFSRRNVILNNDKFYNACSINNKITEKSKVSKSLNFEKISLMYSISKIKIGDERNV